MRIAATLATTGLLLAVGSSAPQMAGAAEPHLDSCLQPASTGGCDGEPGLGRVLPHPEVPRACILPVVYRSGPLESCAPGEPSTLFDPAIIPLHR